MRGKAAQAFAPGQSCAARTGVCPVVVADTAVHRDDSHLSEAYAEALAPVLGASLDRSVGAP